ncbi:hypothetical protein EX30DRAFT_361315 [Ascodesmis nigricans]|uniref:Vacuolar membrane-associated protein IML1 n=1 Tax=Ascodesmis nigricans TaxID=341454 RepID=A0A4S2N7Z6_9PEZI|nr:hypothetical protein EX30DRAFT_361315 [Ascodesmis nigricans]
MSRPSTTHNLYPPSALFSTTHANQTSKTLTLWIHDPDAASSLSKHEAVLNYELFPPGIAKPGDVAEVRLVNPKSAGNTSDVAPGLESAHVEADPMVRRGSYAGSMTDTGEEAQSGRRTYTHPDDGDRFYFVIRELEESQRRLNVQISLATHITNLFHFPSRATVKVTIVDKKVHEASHVEIFFRDQFITRADMWRMTTALLSNTCPYHAQKLIFLNTVRATVGNVYVRGEKVRSAYFASTTIPIFRSESARSVIFIQMSQEMWHFDTDDGGDGDGAQDGDPMIGGTGGVGGEIIFNKLINGFLPELFKRWRRKDVHHLVSIILFTRVVYEHGERVGVIGSGKESDEFLGTPGGIELGEGRRYRDFFRVVVSNMGSMDWTVILNRLKREFAIFLRDVLVQPVPEDETINIDLTPSDSSATSIASRPTTPTLLPADRSTTTENMVPLKSSERKTIIVGRPSAAIHGNILEAINLATLQFSKGHIDRDLLRTGISVILITPGTGHFEVDYEMLKATTEGLVSNGMGVDLVCLSKVPLHSVPLFKYRNPTVASANGETEDQTQYTGVPGLSPPKQTHTGFRPPEPGEWVYAIPHWIDISFWSAASEKKARRRTSNNKYGFRKKEYRIAKRKPAHGFRARCKMYEVQMMGIMENEVACITVPFLHDNPLWRPIPDEGPPASSGLADPENKEQDKKKREQWKAQFSWMDEYDVLAFKPLPQLQEGLKKAEAKRDGREEEAEKLNQRLDEEDSLVLSTSFRSDTGRGSSLRPGFFDRKMKERRPELESPTELTPPSETVTSKTGNTTRIPPPPPPPTTTVLGRPAARLARQLSSGFGLRPWTTQKAAPKAPDTSDVSGVGTVTSGLGPGGVTITRGFEIAPKSSMSSLSSRPSLRDIKAFKSDETPDKRHGASHPISIAGHGKTLSGSSNEGLGRRRTLAGSPLDGRDRNIRDIELLRAASSLSRPAGRSDIVQNAEKTTAIPLTVSPTSALAPWVQVLNPSNPNQSGFTLADKYRRWHHVFPKPAKTGAVKWKSLCTPAMLPLTTEHFPTPEQLATEYQESPYVISQNDEFEITEVNRNREELVRAMIALRLTQGFQIVVNNTIHEIAPGRIQPGGVFHKDYMAKGGSSCFMSRGSQIHQLICDEEYNVEVKRYVRKPMTAIETTGTTGSYISYIKTVLKDHYVPVSVTYLQPVREYNWNYADQYIGGYEDDLTDQLRYWRARFVLIPGDIPETARRGQVGNSELSDEEIRLEGLRRLTMVFQRLRYIPPDERDYQSHRKDSKEKNPLHILYKTVNQSVAVAQERELFLLPDSDGVMRRSRLLTTEMFDSKNLDLKAIAAELQNPPPRGVRLEDRRWHLRLHTNCFIGEEMVTWILENFKDVQTRLEAERVGTELFKLGLFQHVSKRDFFRDGNFFYRISEQYAIPSPSGSSLARPSSKGGWFPFTGAASKPISTSATSTAVSTPSVQVPDIPTNASSPMTLTRSRSRSSSVIEDTNQTPTASTFTTPVPLLPPPTLAPPPPQRIATVTLTSAMKLDIDQAGHSYRPEIITLHYDRLHNPDNCFHLRIEWMTTTAKLIEDALSNWARTLDRYGLRLVEAPIDEVCKVSQNYIFRSPLTMVPAAHPPVPPGDQRDSYYRAVMKKFGFVLDVEAKRRFPQDVRVTYSWGDEPGYMFDQWIHKTGMMFCQVNDKGDFLVMANKVYTLRVKAGGSGVSGSLSHGVWDKAPMSRGHGQPGRHGPGAAPGGGGIGPARHSPGSGGLLGWGKQYDDGDITPESLKRRLEAFLYDREGLERFYDEVRIKEMGPPEVSGANTVPGSLAGSVVASAVASAVGTPSAREIGQALGAVVNVNGGTEERGLEGFSLLR